MILLILVPFALVFWNLAQLQNPFKHEVHLGVKRDTMEVNWDSNKGEVGQSGRIGTQQFYKC